MRGRGLMTDTAEGRLQTALSDHARAPQDLAPLRAICALLMELKREDELAPFASKALALSPRDTLFVHMRGEAYRLCGQPFDALATWRHYAALPWTPQFLKYQIGVNLAATGDLEGGIATLTGSWEAAKQAGDPIAAPAEHMLGDALLKTARPEGFRHFLARNQGDSGNYRPPDIPAWTGEAKLKGRRLLVTHQLGFGDQFLFFACVADWRAAGASVMITCDPQIHLLLQASLPDCVVESAARPIECHIPLPETLSASVRAFAPDLHVSLLHLPMLKATVQSGAPYFRPYIKAPSSARSVAEEWAGDLRSAHPGNALIGFFWDCSQRHFPDLGATMRCWASRRSLPLAQVERLIATPAPVHFINLHHPTVQNLAGAPAGDISSYAPGIRDFADTAACIEQLDAVIAVDSGVANLSAMMGKPTTVLTPHASDWRWGAQGAATPWMSGVKVLRQSVPGDWSTVIDEALINLAAMAPPAAKR